jgi:hypothetical protein
MPWAPSSPCCSGLFRPSLLSSRSADDQGPKVSVFSVRPRPPQPRRPGTPSSTPRRWHPRTVFQSCPLHSAHSQRQQCPLLSATTFLTPRSLHIPFPVPARAAPRVPVPAPPLIPLRPHGAVPALALGASPAPAQDLASRAPSVRLSSAARPEAASWPLSLWPRS